ncbi:DUF4276 family protein [Aminiphilus sp.]|jgi:hypothetical protein|uniref:DUF4276 family protein n=1 Tax=Aminiphilus sp. TaxID=1872488 RepID=UPI0026305AD7|nr:DUF4276 family protein [Aminiphilus sp.]
MIRVHVICEGLTEEQFINELLLVPLSAEKILLLPSQLGRPGHKGGNVGYARLLFDIRERLLRDIECFCTTFLDYYALPSDFPGKSDAGKFRNVESRYFSVVSALADRVKHDLGEDASRRFIPYVQMHEFEALLFSRPESLAKSLGHSELSEAFTEIRRGFSSPEYIDDGPETAPSKRIEKLFRNYDKPLHPILGAREIGLSTIRRECSLFDDWVRRLEAVHPE